MNKNSKIYIAGHLGLVGSAIIRSLNKAGYKNIITRSFQELDLRRQEKVETLFETEKPDYIFLAAAKVGGIHANNTYKAEFIYDNLAIATNIIHAAYKFGAKKLLNLGSSCIYPKLATQPLKEEYLLTGSLEKTNEPYAIAKIAAIKLCQYYNEQYGTNFISIMPTNLYGPNDNFDLETAHVLPSLIRKFHLAKLLEQNKLEEIKQDIKTYPINKKFLKTLTIQTLAEYGITKEHVTLWGTGKPFREFLYVDDLAKACIFLMEKHNNKTIKTFVNIGTGKDLTIKELALLIQKIVGFKGIIKFDNNKPDGTPKKQLDITKINNLGWNYSTELKKGINNSYQWYLQKNNFLTVNKTKGINNVKYYK